MDLTHYTVLGVSDLATPEEIKRAYRARARASHPDSAGSPDANMFALVTGAYEVLRDPDKRAAYDRSLRPFETPAPAPTNPDPAPEPRVTARTVRTKLSWRDRLHNVGYYARTWGGMAGATLGSWAVLVLLLVGLNVGGLGWEAVHATLGATLIACGVAIFRDSFITLVLYAVAVTAVAGYVLANVFQYTGAFAIMWFVVMVNVVVANRVRKLVHYR